MPVGVATSVGSRRAHAESSCSANRGLVDARPEAPGPHERLIVEARRQDGRDYIVYCCHVEAEGRPVVLGRHREGRVHFVLPMARWPLGTKSSQSEEYRLASLCRHPPFTLEISSAPRLELAQAQTRTLRRNGENLILNERPRRYFDASNVVPVSSLNFRTSGYGQTVS